eukprot:4728211-Prymnesium_polylepis.1
MIDLKTCCENPPRANRCSSALHQYISPFLGESAGPLPLLCWLSRSIDDSPASVRRGCVWQLVEALRLPTMVHDVWLSQIVRSTP